MRACWGAVWRQVFAGSNVHACRDTVRDGCSPVGLGGGMGHAWVFGVAGTSKKRRGLERWPGLLLGGL